VSAECPECAAAVPLADDVMASEIVPCPECGLDLETVQDGGGWRLVRAPEEEEDWGE
jgi:alpha-aminoadipate/glutamate carrier protein LysW